MDFSLNTFAENETRGPFLKKSQSVLEATSLEFYIKIATGFDNSELNIHLRGPMA